MSNNSLVNAAVYLNPAACPASENLFAALRCRGEENKSAHSTSCNPLHTHLDTNCPQLCLPARHTHRKNKIARNRIVIVTRDTTNDINKCNKIKLWPLSSIHGMPVMQCCHSGNTLVNSIHHTGFHNSLRKSQMKIILTESSESFPKPPFPAS